jgi:hypothetical protein
VKRETSKVLLLAECVCGTFLFDFIFFFLFLRLVGLHDCLLPSEIVTAIFTMGLFIRLSA